MSTSTIVKLAAGESLTFLVENATEVEGNYGKQIQLDGQDVNNQNVTLYLSLDTAKRQLERIGLTTASVKGEVLKVEKVQKDGRTYTNINRAAGSPTNGKGKPANAAPVSRIPDEDAPLPWEKDAQDKVFAHYDRCFDHAVSLARNVKGADTVITLEGISAVAATIFIATKGSL